MKSVKTALTAALTTSIFVITACGPESSPEGRMTMKIEALQKEMIDSLREQNKSILDSLAALRKDVQELQQGRQ